MSSGMILDVEDQAMSGNKTRRQEESLVLPAKHRRSGLELVPSFVNSAVSRPEKTSQSAACPTFLLRELLMCWLGVGRHTV